MIAREPAPGWRDSDATRAKPTKPCKNGHLEQWQWFRPEQRWVCRLDGEYERGGAPPKPTPRPAAAWPPLDHLLEHDG